MLGRQQHRRGEIVGEPMRHLRHQVGGRGRDDDEVAFARQPDMADIVLVVAVEQFGEHIGPPESAPTESGVTNCVAAAVMMQRTAAPRSRSRRIRSSDL